MNEEERRKERQRIANRERVRRFRAKHILPNVQPMQTPPMSGQERMRNYRQRKKQQAVLIGSILDATDQQLSSALNSSRKRTRLYRQRQRQRTGYQKAQRLSDRECSRRFYAKKKHLEVRQQASRIASRHSTAQDVSPNQQIDPASLAQECILRNEAYSNWPPLESSTNEFKEEILESALRRLRKQMKQDGKKQALSGVGLQLDWTTQLYTFVKLQLKAEREWRNAELKREPTSKITKWKTRQELALLVANAGGWSSSVMKRILQQEVMFIRYGQLPMPKQGRHVKVVSWLTDEGTMLAMREYISSAGEGKCS